MNHPSPLPLERGLCLRCLKPPTTCYCKEVCSIQPFFQLILLQHPLERRKAIGTARMTHLCIENSKLILGTDFDQNNEVNRLLLNEKNHCIVLYPGQNSLNISTQTPEETRKGFPPDKKLVIFVIDGTWHCAKKMLYRSRLLSQLPQICFSLDKKSEYKIRKQPDSYCLSTIEAVHHIIEVLDPTINPDSLLDIFRNMVKNQIRFLKN